jgi:hypothetical protein
MVSIGLSNDKSPRSELKDEATPRSPVEPAEPADASTGTLIVASARAPDQILE